MSSPNRLLVGAGKKRHVRSQAGHHQPSNAEIHTASYQLINKTEEFMTEEFMVLIVIVSALQSCDLSTLPKGQGNPRSASRTLKIGSPASEVTLSIRRGPSCPTAVGWGRLSQRLDGKPMMQNCQPNLKWILNYRCVGSTEYRNHPACYWWLCSSMLPTFYKFIFR